MSLFTYEHIDNDLVLIEATVGGSEYVAMTDTSMS